MEKPFPALRAISPHFPTYATSEFWSLRLCHEAPRPIAVRGLSLQSAGPPYTHRRSPVGQLQQPPCRCCTAQTKRLMLPRFWKPRKTGTASCDSIVG